MLRLAIQAVAGLFLVGAILATVWEPQRWLTLLAVTVGVIGVFYEKRYGGMAPPRSIVPDFQPTGERFVDPETGRLSVVQADPRTGARRYVDGGALPPAPPAHPQR